MVGRPYEAGAARQRTEADLEMPICAGFLRLPTSMYVLGIGLCAPPKLLLPPRLPAGY